ncbi:hypothetical protein LAZ40_11575 [Cereibacter sphaeroides]|uniref:hypothetical protein n=1 Tax=Cereibacter sphaeroides TaxID=1063 RepID=UPI001F1C6289|nr:hypothetical protein [Cereibacter sphaeroides]MCE6959658.1 hypothetical protein [Cereibacter sphaeroides]MCE6974481.1 hypothetical protein [Cereibacter sphaeroides]
MSIEFVDLDKAGPDREEEQVSGMGMLLVPSDGTWHASHPDAGLHLSSTGSLKPLAGQFWLTDVEFDHIRPVADEVRTANVRADGWLRLNAQQIRNAWGLSGHPEPTNARIMGGVANRVWHLIQEVLHRDGANGTSVPDTIRKIQRSASLATGITLAHAQRMEQATPDDQRAREHLKRAYQHGMYISGRKGIDIGEIRLAFQFPRLAYARMLTAAPVPAAAVWQAATRRDRVSPEDFVRDMAATGRPAIYKAVCEMTQGFAPEHVEAFSNRPGASETYRSRWIEEEIAILGQHGTVAVEGAIAGGGWTETSTGRLIRLLEETCGGAGPAASSWSAGLAADNIIASAFRKVGKEKDIFAPEPVWLAARDRVMMFPAVARLCASGASLVSAQAGTITVKAPADPELLMVLVTTAWEQGLHLPLGDVEELVAAGVAVPHERPLFGGADVDYLLSRVVHRGQRQAMWQLDGIMDLPSAERAARFRALLS